MDGHEHHYHSFKVQSQTHLKRHLKTSHLFLKSYKRQILSDWNAKILQKIDKTWPWTLVTLENIFQSYRRVMSLHHWVSMFGQFHRQYHHQENTFENLLENLAGILGQFHCLYHHRQMNFKMYVNIEFGCCDTVNIIIAISLVLWSLIMAIWAKVVLIIRSNRPKCIYWRFTHL